MGVAMWVSIVIFGLLLLVGLLDFFKFISFSLFENGLMATIFIVLFFILIGAPSLTKEFAPQYHDLSVIAIYVYIIGFLIYRFGFKKRAD